MEDKETGRELVDLISELQEKKALEQIKKLIDGGISPLTIFDLCHEGLVKVGEYYEKERYAISGLIMAGEIMRQAGELVFPLIETEGPQKVVGKIVLGTIEGDIHYLGKDIFKTLVRGHGFSVHDLGVDVTPSTFLSAIYDVNPDIVGFSCLISSVYDILREGIEFLRENVPQTLQPKAYIIGGNVNGTVAKKVGADWWASDAMEGVHLCEEIMVST